MRCSVHNDYSLPLVRSSLFIQSATDVSMSGNWNDFYINPILFLGKGGYVFGNVHLSVPSGAIK